MTSNAGVQVVGLQIRGIDKSKARNIAAVTINRHGMSKGKTHRVKFYFSNFTSPSVQWWERQHTRLPILKRLVLLPYIYIFLVIILGSFHIIRLKFEYHQYSIFTI